MMAYAIVIIKYVSDRLKVPEDSTQIESKKRDLSLPKVA